MSQQEIGQPLVHAQKHHVLHHVDDAVQAVGHEAEQKLTPGLGILEPGHHASRGQYHCLDVGFAHRGGRKGVGTQNAGCGHHAALAGTEAGRG